MGTNIPLRLLYAMAVSLAMLAMFALILTMSSRVADLLAPGPSAPTEDETGVKNTVVRNTKGGSDCDGDSAATEVGEGLPGKIVYVCNGDIYSMILATGEIARISRTTYDPRFDWSPDGEKIAWADKELGDLWVANVGGGDPSPQGNDSFATSPEWSPDGKTLAFVSGGKPDERAGLATIPVNRTGSRQKTIISTDEDLGGGSIGSLDWSPDGKMFVFEVDGPPGAKRGLYTVNTDGTDLTKISSPDPDPETNARQDTEPSLDPIYSPSGERIAFVNDWDDGQIYTMNPDGTAVWHVTHDTGGYEIQSWSPNGEKILYEYASSSHRSIFVVNADGTRKQRLATVRSAAEGWNRIYNLLWLP